MLLDLYYRKKVIEHANVTKRMQKPDEFKLDNQEEQKWREMENNHLNYENFLNKHLKLLNNNRYESEAL